MSQSLHRVAAGRAAPARHTSRAAPEIARCGPNAPQALGPHSLYRRPALLLQPLSCVQLRPTLAQQLRQWQKANIRTPGTEQPSRHWWQPAASSSSSSSSSSEEHPSDIESHAEHDVPEVLDDDDVGSDDDDYDDGYDDDEGGVMCDKVTFLVPDQRPLPFKHVKQRTLNQILRLLGAVCFETADGVCSSQVELLPEGGVVELVIPGKQRGLARQQAVDKWNFFLLEPFLRTLAAAENPGTFAHALPTYPFTDTDGQDYVQLNAAVVAGNTLYVAEFQAALGVKGVLNLSSKLDAIKRALCNPSMSPGLAASLQGVTRAKLFVCGDWVSRTMAVQQMVDLAAAQGIAVVLPIGPPWQKLALAGGAPLAVKL